MDQCLIITCVRSTLVWKSSIKFQKASPHQAQAGDFSHLFLIFLWVFVNNCGFFFCLHRFFSNFVCQRFFFLNSIMFFHYKIIYKATISKSLKLLRTSHKTKAFLCCHLKWENCVRCGTESPDKVKPRWRCLIVMCWLAVAVLVVVVSIACRFDVYPNKLSLVVHSNCANVQQRSILLIYLKGKKNGMNTTVRYWIASFVCLWYISVSSWGAHDHSQFQISTDRAHHFPKLCALFVFCGLVQCALCIDRVRQFTIWNIESLNSCKS